MPGDTDIRNMNDLIRDAAAVGRQIARDYPGIEASDIEQEILLAVCANPDRYLGMDAPLFMAWARKTGAGYAAKELRDYMFKHSDWIYTSQDIRALFEVFFDDRAWESAPQKDRSLVTLDGSGLSIPLMDLKAAYEALTPAQRDVINQRYRDHEGQTKAEQMALSRAIDRVVQLVNNTHLRNKTARENHEGPGARPVVSNAQARVVTNLQ